MFASLSNNVLAQVNGSVSVVSNYVYRGVSLSDDKPEAQLSLAYDDDSGWFAGVLASKIDLPSSSSLAIAYAGYAHQLSPSLSWGGRYRNCLPASLQPELHRRLCRFDV